MPIQDQRKMVANTIHHKAQRKLARSRRRIFAQSKRLHTRRIALVKIRRGFFHKHGQKMQSIQHIRLPGRIRPIQSQTLQELQPIQSRQGRIDQMTWQLFYIIAGHKAQSLLVTE